MVITQPASVQDPAYHVVEPLPENLTPHNFLILSVIVAIICGIVSCTTLLCGCIAVAFSAQVSYNSVVVSDLHSQSIVFHSKRPKHETFKLILLGTHGLTERAAHCIVS